MSSGAGGDRVVRMMLFYVLQWTVKCPLHAASSAEPVFPENIAGTLGALFSIAKHGRNSIKEGRLSVTDVWTILVGKAWKLKGLLP